VTLAIDAAGLTRAFAGKDAVDALDLQVAEGEIYGFLGPNGAGKSTTVKMLCTLLRPTGGRATVAGFDVVGAADEVRLRIGVALQDASIDEKQTGRELLALQGRLYGLSDRQVAQRLDEVISLVDIGEAIEARAGTYSGGMKRRLDLAMSLMHRPALVFLDEPTTGLDPVSRVRVWEEVRRLNREAGTTIFLTTQYLEEADELADRVGIIAAGKLVAQGTPTELKRAIGNDVITAEVDGDGQLAAGAVQRIAGVADVAVHGTELTLTAPDGAAVIAEVAVALNGCGVPVRSLTLRTPTLDDVFLQVTGSHLAAGGDA
jgi:ABC-2 type transport system ATP-binding protein